MRTLISLVMALTLGATSCRGEGTTLLSNSELPGDVYGSPRPTPTVTPESLPDHGTVFFIRRGRLHAVELPLQGVAGSLPEALLLALLVGPPEEPKRLTTEMPEDTSINGISVERRVATVDLSSEFEEPAVDQEMELRIAQVVYTLTEPPSSLQAVRFEIEGVPTDVIGGVELTEFARPVTRGDFAAYAPVTSGG